MAAITLLLSVHDSPTVMDLVNKLKTDFNYIFPRRNVNVSLQSAKMKHTNTPFKEQRSRWAATSQSAIS